MPLQKTKTKLKRWFRKRRKISNDEDGWCDAVSSLSLGSSSSSSEEYFDAPEEHQTTRKRKVARRKTSANNTQKEDGKMAYQYSARPIKTIEGERKTNVLYSAKRQGSEEGLKSTGRLFTSKDCSSLPSGSGSSSTADDRVENKDSHRPMEAHSGNRPGTRSVSQASKQQFVVKTQTGSHYSIETQSGNRPGTRSVSQASKQQVVAKTQTDKDSHHSIETQSGINRPGTRSVSQASKQQFVVKTQTDSHRPMEEQSGNRPGTTSVSQESSQQIHKISHRHKDSHRTIETQSGNRPGTRSVSQASKQQVVAKTQTDRELTQCGHVAPICQNRKVTVTLMTSSQMYTIDGLKKKLKTLKNSLPDLIDAVKVLQLPYSRIQYYEFTEDVDIMILCHSIENRRFAITNVTDSLYDEFLDYCYKALGKEKIVVIAHDFPPEAKEVRDVKMDSFKHTQWTTFEKAGLVMICGMMDKKPEMQEEDWDSLVRFLEAASKPTPGKDDPRLPLPGQKDSGECNPESNKWGGSKSQTTKSVSAKISEKTSSVFRFGSPKLVSREPIIYLCTSFGLHSVRGLEANLRNLLEKCHNKFKITAQELPYNYSDLREFRFPAETGANDAMILCHSMQNRGFLITDVENSIYDQYLHHCKKVFGKEHVAVIVHDFDCSEEILGIHMAAFKKKQPKTFELAGFVALAGKLDVTNVQLSDEDSSKLENFVMKIR